MKSIGKVIFVLLFATLFLGGISINNTDAEASTLSHSREVRAKKIAKVTIKNNKKYHVFPSVAIAQAIVESGCGEACRAYNYWGIMSRAYDFSTLEKGTLSYLRLLNKGWYGSMKACKTASQQAYQIAAHGYCQPSNGYYGKIMSAINTYNLKKYDKQLKKYIKEQKRKAIEKRRREAEKRRLEAEKKRLAKIEKQRQEKIDALHKHHFILRYDPIIPEGKIGMDLNGICPLLKTTDTLMLIDHNDYTYLGFIDIFDFEANKVTPIHKFNLGDTYADQDTFFDSIFLYSSDPDLVREHTLVNIYYIEKAKG